MNATWKRCTNKCEARVQAGFVAPWCLIMTEGSLKGSGVYTDLPMPRAIWHPCKRSGQKWVKPVDLTFLSQSTFPGLFDHFVTAGGIETTNLICKIIDFQGTCDPCCHCVLWLRPQVWIDCHEAPSLSRSWKLLWLYFHVLQTGAQLGARWSSSSRNVSQASGCSLSCLPQGPATWKWVLVPAVPPVYVDRSTAGDHEVSEDRARKF